MDLENYILRLKRLDELIRRKQTGCIHDLAKKMALSERHTYRYLKALKNLNAPIEFSYYLNSYHYLESGELKLGWEKTNEELNQKQQNDDEQKN